MATAVVVIVVVSGGGGGGVTGEIASLVIWRHPRLTGIRLEVHRVADRWNSFRIVVDVGRVVDTRVCL